jgi:hypothetical protein
MLDITENWDVNLLNAYSFCGFLQVFKQPEDGISCAETCSCN